MLVFIRINIWFYHLKKNIEIFAFLFFFGWKKSLFLKRINKHFIIGAIITIISILIFFYQGNFSWFPSYWKDSFYKYWVCKCKLCDGVTKLLIKKLLFQYKLMCNNNKLNIYYSSYVSCTNNSINFTRKIRKTIKSTRIVGKSITLLLCKIVFLMIILFI